jgi:hypothetical protein
MNSLVRRRCGVYNKRTTVVNTIVGREVVYTVLYNGGINCTIVDDGGEYNSGTIVVYDILYCTLVDDNGL